MTDVIQIGHVGLVADRNSPEAENANVMICGPRPEGERAAWDARFEKAVEATCADCGAALIHKPNPPANAKKLCNDCGAAMVAAEVAKAVEKQAKIVDDFKAQMPRLPNAEAALKELRQEMPPIPKAGTPEFAAFKEGTQFAIAVLYQVMGAEQGREGGSLYGLGKELDFKIANALMHVDCGIDAFLDIAGREEAAKEQAQ